jgi:hypothetical protein
VNRWLMGTLKTIFQRQHIFGRIRWLFCVLFRQWKKFH